MLKLVEGITPADVEHVLEINNSSSLQSLQGCYITPHPDNEHQESENVTTSVMCDSTHRHITDAYTGESPHAAQPDNMVIIPHYPPMAPSCSEATIQYPSLNDYPGEYNFEILLDGTGSGFKAWMYSYELNKVFIDIGKVLPIQVKLLYKHDEPAPPPLFLRATPIYSQDDHRGRPVERCPLHVSDALCNEINKGFEAVVKHIVRCTSAHCADTVTLMYSFVCKTSCLGGMDRRPILLLLTLENQHGQILGRRSLSVKVCACPKRDKEKEEREFQTSGATRRTKSRKRSFEARVKEEMMDDSELTTLDLGDNKKFRPDLCNLGVEIAALPSDHQYYLMSNMATMLAGMFMKKGNEACRQAAEKCALLVERIKSETDPNAEPF
ncbi:hypothetical protein M8J75_004407 [Diaphorina citri]|nr:hypothetical protein M8J75_004407 [Diaphorina citri]